MEPQGQEAAWHTLSVEQVLQAEAVDAERGLGADEAASRAEQYGPNKLAEGKKESRWHALLRQYQDAMQIALLVAGVVSFVVLKQWTTGGLLILLTIGNAVLGLRQEGEASDEVAALQREMTVTAQVRRDRQESVIPAEQLVPGDVVSITEGDVVPADGRLIHAATLEIDESELTGESLSVSKGTDRVVEAGAALGDRTDMVYMKTAVTRRAGQFVVTATGMATEVGHISGMLEGEQAAKTPLTRQLDELYKQILVIATVALAVSMAVNLSHGAGLTTAFNGAVAFLIAAVPVQLPTVVTSVLAWGTEQLAKAGAIMKQLRSTETLGSTSAICSDKTGTLTLNQMTAVEMAVANHRYTMEGKGYSTDGRINRVAGQTDVPLDPFLMPMVLASDAVISDGKLIGDPTEGALRRAGGQGRNRRRLDAAGVPENRGGSLRCRIQADGDLPPDDKRIGRGRGPLLREGRTRSALGARRLPAGSRHRVGPHRRRSPEAVPGPRPEARGAGPEGHGHRPTRSRPADIRPRR